MTTAANVAPAQDAEALIGHILERYHATHRRELAELIPLAQKVERVHGDHSQRPAGLADLLTQMQAELEHHMMREEQVLFPTLLAGGGGCAPFAIRQMRHEHDDHAELLRALAERTNGFAPPDEACRSWRALYEGCAKLAADLKAHIALENDVLFPAYEAF